MEQNEIQIKLIETQMELQFMYRKYEELCQSYKKLAEKTKQVNFDTTHDMSRMSFIEK